MKTRIAFLFFIFSLCTIQLNAQKCKYTYDKVDPMTNERVRRITYPVKMYFKVSFYRKASDFRVELNVTFGGERNFKILAGETMDLKLTSGTILTLSAAQDANPVSFLASEQVMTGYGISYNITKEQMQQIATSGFSVVRVKMGGEELTVEANSNIVPKTLTGAACMITD